MLGPGRLKARSRPLLVLTVAAVRAGLGLCLAWPLASLIAESGVGALPQGDRALFESGGYLLLEVARVHGPALLAAAGGLLPMLGLGLLAGAACDVALLVGLNHAQRPKVSELVQRATSELPAFALVGAGTRFLQLVVVLGAAALAGAVPQPLAKPVQGSLGQAAVWLGAAMVLGALGGAADVARAARVRHGSKLGEALQAALRLARRYPVGTCFGWVPYGLLLAAAVAGAGWLTETTDVSRPGAWRVLAVFVVHQLVILTAVAARAAWYARALRLAATQPG